MSEIKLLPCPFCGGEAMLDREYIFCDECHLIMRIDDRLYNKEAETYEEARKQTIEAWNTRKPMERIIEKLEEKLSDTNFEKATQECNESYVDGLSMGYAGAIGICKQEGGIE